MKTKTMFNKKQSNQEIVAEIHETFYTEVDRLLEKTGIIRSTDTAKQDVIDKANRLRSLGFGSAKPINDANTEEERIRNAREENIKNKSLKEAILYFKAKYPLYKFITENSVKKICDKYGLIYGDVKFYIGDVPDKNLEQIEKFKVDDKDCVFKRRIEHMPLMAIPKWDQINHKVYSSFISKNHGGVKYDHAMVERVKREGLQIAAPSSDFNLKLMDVKDNKIVKREVPDPIVLHPVQYKGDEHYLIVTAWGPEASDENVVNEINN